MPWAAVEQAVPKAKSIAFDGCHKIYLLLDDEQTQQMITFGYRDNDAPGGSRLFTAEEMAPDVMLKTLREWFDNSCPLRFISGVTSNREDPNAGYTQLIAQGEDEDEED